MGGGGGGVVSLDPPSLFLFGTHSIKECILSLCDHIFPSFMYVHAVTS